MDTPPETRFRGVRKLANGGLIYELNTTAAAKWMNTPENKTKFLQHYGGGENTSLKGRAYQVLVDFTPILYDDQSVTALRNLEAHNELPPYSITEARWVKPIQRREQSQRTALL
ncbi:hypothetical protein BDW22DRAFT_1339267, partial [Trametopsis cervina]